MFSPSFTDPYKALAYFGVNYHEIDLAIIDVTMPGMSGVELVKDFLRIKPDLPLVFLSGRPEVFPTDETGGPLPAKRILTKPITKGDLQDIVEAILGPQCMVPDEKD